MRFSYLLGITLFLFLSLSSSSMAKEKNEACIKHSHLDPDSNGTSCSCDKGYTMNPEGNVCCGPNAVWQNGKCNTCVKNAHPNIQIINGIEAAVSCDCDDGFVMNKEGNVCSPKK